LLSPARRSRSRRLLPLFGSLLILSGLLPLAAAPVLAATPIFINEIHYDNAGTDSGETVEIAGPAGTSLTGWAVVLYNGSGGASYLTVPFSGVIENLQNGFGTASVPTPGIQNGAPDGIALVNGSTVVQFLSYEGSFTATNGPAVGMVSVDVGVDQEPPPAVGFSIGLTGTGTSYEDFAWTADIAVSFGNPNPGQTFSTGDAAPSVTATSPIDGAAGVALDANVSVTFSEAVNVAGSWFSISCGVSGTHTAAVTGGPQTFTLNPDADFVTDESCTVTILASQVTDQDAADPPDAMLANATFAFATVATVPNVWINEFHYDNTGTDAGEAVEVAGQSGTNLAGWSIVLYNGSNGAAYDTDALAGTIPNQQGGLGTLFLTYPANGLQNGSPDGIALVAPGGVLVQFLSYEGTMTGIGGPAGGVLSTDVGVTEAGTEPVGLSLQLVGTGGVYEDFTWAGPVDDTFGQPNTGQTFVGGEQPPAVSTTSPANGAVGIPVGTPIGVTFSEPVDVAGAWFDIDCALSGTHTASVAGGPTSFTLQPSSPFANSELCTVTIVASQVTDQDTNDPPNAMEADHVFSFTTVGACGDAATFIHDIQGSGATTPMTFGTPVEIEGVVVGDFQASTSFNGFHVQDEDADADSDDATSEGIFVFEGGSAVAVAAGDRVRVAGEVTEFTSSGQQLTELTDVTSVEVCSSGQSVTPADVSLPFANLTFAERYEGMLASFDQELTVTETFTLGRFGEVALSIGGRLFNPTAVVEPGAPAQALQALNDRSRILLDDGDNQQNIDPTVYPQGGLSASNTLRIGDTLDGGTFVLEQRFGVYRLQPSDAIAFQHDNPRPVAPDPVGGNLRIAAMNVLNFFDTLDLGPDICGPSEDLECRGADSAQELIRQRDKIVSALAGLDGDVVGLMEIENDADDAVRFLVEGLNAEVGAGTYDFIRTGTIGTDAIKLAIIYKPSAVTPVGSYAVLDTSVDSRFIDTRNRPSLAQTFERAGETGRFTVVVNHLKSKGSACLGGVLNDPDTGDGSGNCNLTREAAAEALVDWIATDPTGSGDRDVLVIGDMNAYAKEDPIDVFLREGYTDMIAAHEDEAYSFVFQGQSGYLDHALASPTLAAQVTGATEWHANADEPVVLDYNTEFKSPNHVNTLYAPDQYRSSDHDPLVVGVQLLDYDFDGFRPPVANPPAINLAKAGSSVPIKFRLGGNFGLGVFFGSPKVFACADWPLGPSVPATGDPLTYDSSSGVYTFAWKTSKSWATSCRRLEVTFDDGTYRVADFSFTK
jgi:predicted extracellular nuclease